MYTAQDLIIASWLFLPVSEMSVSPEDLPNTGDHLSQLVWRLLNVEDAPKLVVRTPDSLIFDHSRVHPHIVALNLQHRLRLHSLEDVVVITMRTVFVGIFELVGVLAEALLAFLAGEGHLVGLEQRVLLSLAVAISAIEPFAAWRRSGTELMAWRGGIGRIWVLKW